MFKSVKTNAYKLDKLKLYNTNNYFETCKSIIGHHNILKLTDRPKLVHCSILIS